MLKDKKLKQHIEIKRLVLTGLFTAFGILLPMAFHIFNMGSVMLPMHIPVLLCGLICGSVCGGICGILSVLMSSMFTGMPPIYPVGVAMMFELFAYGFFSGLFMKIFKKYNISLIYVCLILAMLIGRCFSAAANALLLGLKNYTFTAFATASFIKSFPGIITQLILIPILTKFIFTFGKLEWIKENQNENLEIKGEKND